MAEMAQFQEFKPGILVAEAEMRMPLMSLPARATAVEVSPRQWVLISPINPKKCDYQSLKRHGEVVAIVAPSCLHHLFVPAVQALFPAAKLWAAPGLRDKRADIPWNYILGQNPWPYGGTLQPIAIQGMPKLNENVFYVPQAETLVVTDLFFNLLDARGLGAWLILNLFGTYRRFGVSRLFWLEVKDRKATEASLQSLMDLNFDALLMAHGKAIHSGAYALVQKQLAQLL